MSDHHAGPPIIVVSVGRSGSTLLHEVLTLHPDAAWLTSLASAYPARPGLQRLFLQAVDLPVVGRILRRRWRPTEAYEYWERYAKGFQCPSRDLRPGDLTPRTRRDVLPALHAICTRRRQRLLLKITGWSRISYLRELFPDARFVHIVRDGRAVVNSVLQTPWWLGWRGPTAWRFGELTPEDRDLWETYDRSFVVLAALQWRFVLRSIESALRQLPQGDFQELSYEDLCAEPVEAFRQIASFCSLPWTGAFDRAVRRQSFHGMNAKFLHDLSPAQIREIEDVIGPMLARYGYA